MWWDLGLGFGVLADFSLGVWQVGLPCRVGSMEQAIVSTLSLFLPYWIQGIDEWSRETAEKYFLLQSMPFPHRIKATRVFVVTGQSLPAQLPSDNQRFL